MELYCEKEKIKDNSKAFLGIPVMFENEVICFFMFKSFTAEVYSDKEMELMTEIAEQVRYSIINAMLFDKINKMAKEDMLTKIFNRRYFFEIIENEYKKYLKYKHQVSFIIFDIDHFKKVNDTYGHLAGDEVIKKVVNKAKEILNGRGVFARYGGEEFVVLLPEKDIEEGFTIAESIRENICKEVFKIFDFNIPVSSSFGVTSFKEGGSVEKMMERADEALYNSKETGRNRVSISKNIECSR